MQEAAREAIRRLVADDDEPDNYLEDDFGFNYPFAYVIETGQLFLQSKFQFTPRAGGWEDQDPLWRDDMMVFLRLYHRASWEYNQEMEGERQGVSREDTRRKLNEPLVVSNWQNAFGMN